ncbi:integrase catalytic domain-containing protein [Trichonephila clavipes]|nr:integrase catalytic domain-containing protein [Trichonephila clavipes]
MSRKTYTSYKKNFQIENSCDSESDEDSCEENILQVSSLLAHSNGDRYENKTVLITNRKNSFVEEDCSSIPEDDLGTHDQDEIIQQDLNLPFQQQNIFMVCDINLNNPDKMGSEPRNSASDYSHNKDVVSKDKDVSRQKKVHKLICPYCSKCFKTLNSKLNHVKSIHKVRQSFIACQHCDVSCKDKVKLQEHYKHIHNKMLDISLLNGELPKTSTARVKCIECNITFGLVQSFRDHLTTYHDLEMTVQELFFPNVTEKCCKNCRKEDLRIVALELGETVAEKVTIIELTEIIKENKYFKEDVEFVKELIQYTIEDRKRVEEDRKKEAENRLREKELELELARLNVIENRNNPVKNASRVFLSEIKDSKCICLAASHPLYAKGKEHCGFIQAADNLEHSIKKFWEIENVEIDSVKTSELDICEDHFKNTHSRDDQGRYTVAMPLKEDPSCLGESRQTAIQRLNSLWKRLSRDKEYLSLYEKFLQEYEDLGHMREIKEDGSGVAFYMPHHGVYRPEKSTTKLRTVFNASSPSTRGKSLNSIQFNGGLIQEDLFSIMVRFRKHKYAFTTDIEKMFRMINIHPEQTCLQRILWKKGIGEPIKRYELTTVTYGTAHLI